MRGGAGANGRQKAGSIALAYVGVPAFKRYLIIMMVVGMMFVFMMMSAMAIVMATVIVKCFAVDRLWAVIHRWRRVDMALAFVHNHFALWFSPVIRTECCPGSAANRSTHNRAITTVQIMADHGTQCPT